MPGLLAVRLTRRPPVPRLPARPAGFAGSPFWKGGSRLERFHLKNIIILILVLLNGFLLFSLAQRRTSEQNAYRRTVEQLVALFQRDGMDLDPGAISRASPPSGVSLVRDTALEEQAAAFLLGQAPSSSDQGGGIFHYAGAAGEALFRSSGGFEAAGTLAGRDAGEFCREFCRAFSYEVPDIRLDGGGSGVFTAAGVFGKLPVFNCTVTFTIQEGVLTAVSGTLLPKSGVPSPEEEPPLSAARAPADAAGELGGGLHRDGHPAVLRAPDRRVRHVPGSRVARRHRHGGLLCKLPHRGGHRREPPGGGGRLINRAFPAPALPGRGFSPVCGSRALSPAKHYRKTQKEKVCIFPPPVL